MKKIILFAILAMILVSCGSSKKATTSINVNADHYDPMTREIWDGLVVKSGLQSTTQLYVSDSVLIVRDKQTHDFAENDEEGKLLQHFQTPPIVALRQYFPCTFSREVDGTFWVNVKINGTEMEIAMEEKKDGKFEVKSTFSYQNFGYALKKGKAHLLYMPDPDPTDVVKGTGVYVGGNAVKNYNNSSPNTNPALHLEPKANVPPGAPWPK